MFNDTLRQVGDYCTSTTGLEGRGHLDGSQAVKEVGANHSLLYKRSIDVYGYTVHTGMMKAITQ
jgi:hypothetical protein